MFRNVIYFLKALAVNSSAKFSTVRGLIGLLLTHKIIYCSIIKKIFACYEFTAHIIIAEKNIKQQA